MKKSKFTILLLFLVMILAISAASAADVDDTSDSAVQAADEASVDEVASADVDDVVSTDSAADVVADPVVSTSKNFTQLKDDIASSHGYLPLASNYVRVAGEEDIEITSGVVIVGNDEYYIDANNLGGIFKITNSESIVVLNNVILKNGNSNNGGAIYNEGTLTISSSQLTNNNASFGGAIYNTGHLIINSGSALNGNTATNQGGAIYSKGTTTIETVTFENNKITTGSSYAETQTDKCNGGGAIYNEGSLTATDSTFTKNTAPHDTEIFSAGGAIYNIGASEVLVDDCTFTENSAVYSGAIMFEQFSQDTVAVKNSRFNGNKAWQGGAIYGNDLVGSLIITGSNFTANVAVTPNAGQSSPCGGAIMVGTKSYTGIALDVEGCNFVENDGGYMGGAIASSPNNVIEVSDSNFTSNVAAILGGAIVTGTGTELTVTGSTFTGNEVSDTTNGMGGAIFAEPNSECNITGSTFTGNVDRYPVAIMNYAGTLDLAGNTFDDNSVFSTGTITSQIKVTVLGNTTVSTYTDVTLNATVTDDNGNFIRDSSFNFVVDGKRIGATIDVANKIYTVTYTIPNPGIYTVGATSTKGEEYTVKNGTVKNYRGTFKDLANKISNAQSNKLDLEYDFAYTPELGDDAYVNGVVINSALTIDGHGYTISGSNAARIFNVNAATLNLTNVTIRDSKANTGAGIYLNSGSTLKTDYVNFTNNTATYKGGAIYSKGIIIANHTVFDSNNISKADGNYLDYYGGAAIYNLDGTLTVDNSVFNNNLKDYVYGVTTDNGDKLYGAITTSGTVIITNSNFTANKGRWGSSISLDPTSNKIGSILLYNCRFTDNLAYQGGAINLGDSMQFKFTINNCWFENNTACGKGSGKLSAMAGALYIDLNETVAKGEITGTTFINNRAIDVVENPSADLSPIVGGAIEIDCKEAIIKDCVFIGNTAEDRAGAIYVYTITSLTIDNVTFDSNEAANAGAIWAYDNVNVVDSRFTNNIATNDGGAIYFTKYCTSSSVTNSNFTDNSAGNNGGAIYVATTDKSFCADVTVSGSNFTNNVATGKGNAIYQDSDSKLTLSGNDISKTSADIVSQGTVLSTIIIKVMNDGTAYHFANITLQANVTDDNYNPMNIAGLKLTVNDTANTQVSVTFNPATGLHEGTYTPIEVGKFNIGATYTTTGQLDITTANITIARSLIDIQNMINAANSGDTITLDGDYAYIEEFDKDLTSGIIVNKTVTINGNNHIINGSDTSRIFYIKANNVTLTDIIFTNGNASGKWGGAIYVNGAYENLTISNSKFYNNTASVNGGAIYWAGDKGKLIGSEFKDNVAGESGGAVFWFGDDGNITGTTFENNTAASHGGAVVWFTNGVVGGHNGVIDDSTFIKNTANAAGGAVSWQSPNGQIKDSTFTENSAPNAGAIYWGGSEGTVSGGKFSKNQATANLGGAIFVETGDLNISSEFEDNHALNGGAVALFANGNIKASNFTYNVALSQGGAIFVLNANAIVNGSTFTHNTASAGGRAIYVNNGELALQANTIDDVVAAIDVENGAKVISDIKVIILDAQVKTIDTLKADLYAKVTDDTGVNLIKDAQFKFTINGEEVQAVYNASSKLYEATYPLPVAGIYPVNITYVTDNRLEVQNATIKCIKGTFTDLASKLTGTDATLEYNFTYVPEIDGEIYINGVTIEHAITINGNGYTIDGNNQARIFRVTAATTLNNITFVNGNATEFGGAIYATADLTVNNSVFDNNSVSLNDANGGAIVVEATADDLTLNINNVKFTNNKVDNGGAALAVAAVGHTLTYNIYDSLFENNTAETTGTVNAAGGAIFSYGTTVGLINNTTFKANKAETGEFSNGGAIKIQFGGTLTVANSTFENNIAGHNGGAISVQADTGMDCKLTVDNCTFTGNDAEYGAAIVSSQYVGSSDVTIIKSTFDEDNAVYIDDATNASISTSQFTSAKDYAINNTGILKLDDNTVKSIYNDGKIITELNATFLENKTWNDSDLGDIYILNATLTDQNGNKIYDPNFRFAVNGVNITDILYNETTGLYTIGYYIATAGPKVVSTNYQATNLKTYDGILDIAKANVTEFTVSVADTLAGDNATVIITLIGVNDTESKPIKLNATVRLFINNEEIPVTVENGTATVPIENLTRGAYPVYVLFDGDSNYNKTINSTEFYVKGNSTLTVDDVVANYSDVIEVTIKLTDGQGNQLTGIVVIEDEFEVLVQNGMGVWKFDLQPDVGELTYTAVYNGTNDVFGSVDGFKITINPKVIDPNDVVVDIPQQSEFGKDIPVTITSPVDGNYTVNVNGTTVNVEVINSTGNATIPALATAGYYNATVTIVDGNYSLDKTTDDFEYFTTPEFNVLINGTYPTAEISITGPAGTYHVLIDGFETINITREDSGLPTFYTIPDIAAGNYTAWVSFDHDGEYYGYAKDVNFTVEKANSTIIISDIADTVYGNPVVLNYTIAPDTDYETIGVYTIDGGDVQADIVAKDGKVTIYNLTAGEYVIRIHTPGNDNYTELEETKAFNVTKAEAITITVDNETSLGPMGTTNVTVTIAGDATGDLFIDADGAKSFAKLVNGSYTFPIYNLTAGEYVINVTYLGDANYNKTNLVKVLNIPQGTVTPVISDVTAEILGGQNATFTVDIDPDFATGNVTVFVDGVVNQVVVLDADYANATVTISGLGNGTHTIAVQYNGNDNYLPSANVTTTVTVTRAGSKVTINPIIDSYNGNVTVNYAIENETDNVTISITDAKGNSYEGIRESGSIILTNLPAGKYTVTINNGQDAYYEESESSATFNVYDNVVTKDNFYAYFDENGKLRDIVPFDELIFKGKFADLVDVITIDRPLIITGEDAVLNNICIDVQSDDVTISNLNMSVIVGDVNAIAINVVGVVDVNIINNNIYFESDVAQDNATKSAIAINIEHAENIIVDGNKITTLLNGVDANYDDGAVYAEYGMMGVSNVNPIRILGSEAITFTDNDVNSSLKGIVGYWPTIQAVLAVGSKDMLFDNNNFTMVDGVTPAGTPSYLYAFTFGFDEDTTVSGNNFYMSTAGGKDGEGTAYAVQIVSSEMDIIGNNITSVSNGPNLGIYAVADWYGMGPAVKLYIAENNINVTGYAANTTNNRALVSGIEVGAGKVEIDNNVINVYNKAGYVEGAYVHGISYAQGYSGPTFNIHNNEIYVNDGDYAVGLYSAYGVVVDNYLVAHDLHGDDAVDYLYDAVVKYNFPQDLDLYVYVDDVYVNSAIEIYVYTNGLFNGKVIVTVNGKDEEVNVTDGIGFLELSSLPASKYNVTAKYAGDLYFLADEDNCTFEVFKYESELNITTGEVVIDQELFVNITLPFATGEVTVTVDGNIVIVNLVDGEGNFTIPKANMTNGTHSIVAVFAGNNEYESAQADLTFTVPKAEDYPFNVNLTIDDIDYGKDITFNVTLPEDATGNVNVYVDGKPVTYAPVVEGNATVTIPADEFTTGNHTITVSYGDKKYAETNFTKAITINKLVSEISASAADISLDENATVFVTLSGYKDGKVFVEINGIYYPVIIKDGKGNATISGLSLGNYTAYVSLEDDSVYEDAMNYTDFKVVKADPSTDFSINVTVPTNTTTAVFTITAPKDAEGYLLVDIDGKKYYAPVENGTATLTVTGLTADNYTANVTYSGDDKYDAISQTTNVTVPSNLPEDAISIPNSTTTTNPTFGVNLPSDATGYIEVDVDGKKYYAAVENGKASVSVPGLTTGKHNVTVTYSGDDKYTKISKSATVTLTDPVYALSGNNLNVVYSANGVYKVLVTVDGAPAAGKTVTINFNGKNYNVVSDAKGYATLKLNTKVKPKTYTITATINGVSVKNTIKVKHVIKAKNKKAKKSKKLKLKVSLKKVNGKYLKGKKLKLKFKGKTYKAKTNKKGKATFTIKKKVMKKLKKGKKYKYTVTYGKDKVTKKIKIKK